MLLAALSFHSVFEGITIGLQDKSADLRNIFIAVMVHKALIAFSLGLNIAQSDLSSKNFIIKSSIVFSLASPLGVIVGILMSDLPPSLPSDICNGFLQCVTGGLSSTSRSSRFSLTSSILLVKDSRRFSLSSLDLS